MKKLFTILFLFFCADVLAQNVGIGETAPTETRLQIKRTDSALLLLHNSSFGTDVKSGLFFKSGSAYSGSIITTGSTFASTFRMGFSTFGAPSPAGLVERISILDGGNVGIGNINPLAKLDVNGQIKISGGTPGTGKLLESDATGLATWVDKSASFLPAGTNGTTLRHNGTIWVNSGNIFNNGASVGIGTGTPGYLLDINGRARLRHNGVTAGMWYNKTDNTEAAFVGMFNDTTFGFYGTSGWSSGFDVKNNLLGVGVLNPTAPLSFPNNIGNKIALWGDATGGHYGLGIQGSLLQMYSSGSNADIAFGYGSSNSFTENMRIKGNGKVGIGTTNPLGFLGIETIAAPGDFVNLYSGGINTSTTSEIESKIGQLSPSSARAGYFQAINKSVCTGVEGHAEGTFYSVAVSGTTLSGGAAGSRYAGYFQGNLNYTGTLTNVSDITLKKNIQPFENALVSLNKIQIKKYEFTEESKKTMSTSSGVHIGVLAQQLQEVFPTLVTKQMQPISEKVKDNNGIEKIEQKGFKEYLGVNYMELIPVLIKGMQEQQVMIEELKKKIEVLEKR